MSKIVTWKAYFTSPCAYKFSIYPSGISRVYTAKFQVIITPYLYFRWREQFASQ